MSNRINKEREVELTPIRVQTAVSELRKLNIKGIDIRATIVKFEWKGSKITYYPYSGWASGKTITDGRGLQNLLKQLKS